MNDMNSVLTTYHQEAQWVPKFYTRPGPGMYEVTNNMETLSQHPRSASANITQSGMLKGTHKKNGPKHRFTDFSKAQI